jgi:hypothetical protein
MSDFGFSSVGNGYNYNVLQNGVIEESLDETNLEFFNKGTYTDALKGTNAEMSFWDIQMQKYLKQEYTFPLKGGCKMQQLPKPSSVLELSNDDKKPDITTPKIPLMHLNNSPAGAINIFDTKYPYIYPQTNNSIDYSTIVIPNIVEPNSGLANTWPVLESLKNNGIISYDLPNKSTSSDLLDDIYLFTTKKYKGSLTEIFNQETDSETRAFLKKVIIDGRYINNWHLDIGKTAKTLEVELSEGSYERLSIMSKIRKDESLGNYIFDPENPSPFPIEILPYVETDPITPYAASAVATVAIISIGVMVQIECATDINPDIIDRTDLDKY